MNNISPAVSNEKHDLHKAIDNSFNHILKSLGFIFDGMKYNEVQYLEEANDLELSTSTLSISNELNHLLKLTNDMKVKYIKSYEPKKMKLKGSELKSRKSDINNKLANLQELHNEMNNHLKEWKLSKSYKLSLTFYYDAMKNSNNN